MEFTTARRLSGAGITWMITAVIAAVLMTRVAAGGHGPFRHTVGGGGNGWKEDVNFTDWAATEAAQNKFYVGDWLYFVFDKQRYNVLQVNQTSYETCNDRDFIFNVTRGGRDVFKLTAPIQYYFLSGGGYCYHGMKVAVNAVDYVEAPAPAQSGSAPPISQMWSNPVTVSIFIGALLSAIFFSPLW